MPSELNGQALDRFTLVHITSGILLGISRVPLSCAVCAAVGWEIVERPLKSHWPSFFANGLHDRLRNEVTDSTAVLLGWGIGRAILRARR